jgi:murein DD-endopeptidase MepM/ murein hydrolase activator NlpD
MTQPVANARVSSGFGMRMHPILGYSRFHKGMDFAAVHGTPVRAVTDGMVAIAGRHGGNGNFVRLSHSAALGTSYSHLSRIAVSPGSYVRQGQVIGYVGSTGLSTGPHLHFEVYRNGAPVNPRMVSFESRSLLSGQELALFRARLNAMLSIPVAGQSSTASNSSQFGMQKLSR